MERATTGPSEASRPPTGASREALLRAATTLFGERGPAAVTTRAIAAEAGVNVALIHRHFGGKDGLLREVLERLAREISSVEKEADEGANLVRFFLATRERVLYWKLLAHCVIDGVPLERIQAEYPTIERIVALVRQMQARGWGPAASDPREIAALLAALALGWLVFEPWLLRATGLDDEDPDAIRASALRTAAALLGIGTARS